MALAGVLVGMVWSLRAFGGPEDTPLENAKGYTGLANKLRQWPGSPELEQWLVKELKKKEGDELDPSIWE